MLGGKMKRARKLFIAVVLLLLVATGFIFLWTNLNWFVKNAIEHYGSQATKTSVRVASVSIKPAEGKGAIEGLTVANPKGFTSARVLSLGSIMVKIDPGTITTSPVVIDDVHISSPLVVYEMDKSGTSNIDVLKKNIASSGGNIGKQPSDKKKPGKETRLRINKLMVESGRVDVLVSALGARPKTVTLKRIEITDIGGQTGATPDQIAKQVLNAIVTEVTREVADAGARQLLDKGLQRALEQMRRQ
jgi:hypothetical protein